MNTFRSTFILNRAADKSEQILELTESLRSKGYYPQGYWFNENGTVTFGGNISCTCEDKFDKAYCDEERCSVGG